jgi:hypothetical protein
LKKYPELQLDILRGDNVVNKIRELNNNGCLNGNPFFNLGNFDWETVTTTNSNTSFTVENVLYNEGLFINGGRSDIYSTNLFSIPYGYNYQMKIRLKSLYDDQPKSDYSVEIYAGIVCYDAMLRVISPLNVTITKNKNTSYINEVTNLDDHKFYLVNDLNAGDTEITLQGNPDYLYQGNTKYARSLRFYKQSSGFRYTDESGHTYDEWAYSRDVVYDPQGFYNKSITDNGNGTFTLTLRQAYNGPTWLAGDGVLNCRNGGIHPYFLTHKGYAPDGEIHTLSSNVRRASSAPKKRYADSLNVIRNGTVYGKIILYANYAVKDNNRSVVDRSKVKTWVSSIELIQTVP